MPHSRRDDFALAVFVAGLAVLFTMLACTVWQAHGPLALDHQIVALIAPWRGTGIDFPMRAATFLCSWQVIVGGTIVAIVVFVMRHRYGTVILLLVAVAGDQIIVSTLKAIIQRPRPEQALAILPATGTSFPSGHTFICVAFYGLLAGLAVRRMTSPTLRTALIGVATIWTLTVATSRVYLGAHWPTDVFGSMVLGTAWILALLAFDRLVSNRAAIADAGTQ